MKESVTIFISYAHQDDELRIELRKHLSQLKQQNIIMPWDDQDISAGAEWEGEIATRLNTANIILLLITPDFLHSEYCYSVEMKHAMQRHEAGEAVVLPIILRSVAWEQTPFGKLQALPREAQAVTSWSNKDEAFTSIARDIQRTINEKWPEVLMRYTGEILPSDTFVKEFRYASFRETYKQWRDILISLIERLTAILSNSELDMLLNKVRTIQARVGTDSFKLLIMGEYNRGKSTLINALLGERVLPTDIIRTTAIICEVKWGEQPKAILHFDKGLSGTNKEIPIAEIKKYITIQDDSTDVPQKLEVFWPLSICREGVEVIDSPGLNEADSRDKITLEYLSSADAIIFTLACDYQVSKSEEWAIQVVRQSGKSGIFFVCNKIDLFKNPEDREKVEHQMLIKTEAYSGDGKKNVFFTSALDALEGRLNKDIDRLNISGIQPFEQALWAFLVSKKGRVKLQGAINELKILILEYQTNIENKRKQLFNNSELDIQRSLADQKRNRKIEQYEEAYDNIDDISVEEAVRKTVLEFLDAVQSYFSQWTYSPEHSMEWWQREKHLSLSQAQTKVRAEYIDTVNSTIEEAFQAWPKAIIRHLFSQELRGLRQKLGKKDTRLLERGLDILLENSIGKLTKASRVYKKIVDDGKSLEWTYIQTKEIVSNETIIITNLEEKYFSRIKEQRLNIAQDIAKLVDEELTNYLNERIEDRLEELEAEASEEQSKRALINQQDVRFGTLIDEIKVIENEIDKLMKQITSLE